MRPTIIYLVAKTGTVGLYLTDLGNSFFASIGIAATFANYQAAEQFAIDKGCFVILKKTAK